MYKLLFIEPVSFPTHYNYNVGILRNIPINTNIDICAAEGYVSRDVIAYNKYFCIPKKLIYKFDSNDNHPQIRLRMCLFKTFKWIKKNIEFDDYDVILFAYTEAITFRLTMNHIKQKTIFIDHEIGSTISSKIKLLFFKQINHRYVFWAFEDYIKDYLKEIVEIKNSIVVVRHPLPDIHNLNTKYICKERKQVVLFAPANSNNESFVKDLYENRDMINDSMQIIIKNKTTDYKDSKTIFFKDRLMDVEYKEKMSSCDAVLINYGSNYNFRTSGVFFEAVKYRKPIIMCTDNSMKYYAKTYKEIVFPFFDINDFIDKQSDICDFVDNVDLLDFNGVISDYSDETIKKEISMSLL